MRSIISALSEPVIDKADEVGLRVAVGEDRQQFFFDDGGNFGLKRSWDCSEGVLEADELEVGDRVIGVDGKGGEKAAGGEEVFFWWGD